MVPAFSPGSSRARRGERPGFRGVAAGVVLRLRRSCLRRGRSAVRARGGSVGGDMSPVRGLTRLALVAIGSGVLLLGLAQGSGGAAPLRISDIVRYLHAGISESTILTELSTRGLAEPLDGPREAALREAGATETLVVAVRRAAPSQRPAPPPAPRLSPTAPTGPPAAVALKRPRSRLVREPSASRCRWPTSRANPCSASASRTFTCPKMAGARP